MAEILPVTQESALQHVSRAVWRENSLSIWSWDESKLVTEEAANHEQAYMIGKECLEAGISPHPVNVKIPNLY